MKLYAQSSHSDTTIYIKADVKPSFPGGYKAFANYIESNKPEIKKINSNRFVVARVIVEKDGKLMNPFIIYHYQTTPGLDSAAIQLLKNSPAWKPAMNNGVPMRVSFNVQVRFETAMTEGNSDHEKIYTAVEQLPQFSGGTAALSKYLSDSNRLKGQITDMKNRAIVSS